MLTRIAVPLDGSSVGDAALPYAIALARLGGATLTLLHVHRTFHPGHTLEALPQFQFQNIVGFDLAADRDAYRREETELSRLAEEVRATHTIAVESRLLKGEVPAALAEFAQSTEVDLFVMGTHGYAGAWRTWLESISDRVVRSSPVPTLLVRAAEFTPQPSAIDLRRILVPLDGSPFSEAVLEPVIALAQMFGARVTLLQVLQFDRRGRQSPGSPTRFECEDHLDRLAGRFPVMLPVPEVRVLDAEDVGEAIAEVAERGGFDAVAMATHGRGGLRHMLLGSTADDVIGRLSLPLLLLRPQVPATAPVRDRVAEAGQAAGW
jgi:nucleotide-binding universal stress UspA family protein